MRQRMRLGPGLALAACLLFLLGLGASPPPAQQPSFPPRIGQLSLTKVVTQKAARDSLDAIHEERIDVARAAIAHYQGPGASVVVWWSRSASEEEARAQLERMVVKIRRGSYPYGHYRELKRQGIAVHSFLGHGQTHYTYRRAAELYWITAPARLIDIVFDAVMR